MMHSVCCWFAKFLLAAGAVVHLTAQDFDWVPSYMKPFRIPRMYAIVAGKGALVHATGIGAFVDGGVVCAQYGGGNGWSGWMSVGTEWWLLHDVALSGGIGIGWMQSEHRADGTVAPLVTGETLRTEYALSTSRIAINVQAAVKKRLFARYGWLSMGVEGTILLPALMVQTERVVEPGWYRFNTTPPSQQVRIGESMAADHSVQLSIVGGIGYDVSIREGMYCSPTLEISLPLTLITGDYRLWRIGIAVPLAFSLR